MRIMARTLMTLSLALLLASPLAAGDKKKKKDRRKKARRPAAAFRLPESIQLTDDQKAQIQAIQKEFGPKLREMRKKLGGILTKEQRRARVAAGKAARAAGKKGKELRQAINAAVQLTDEQKKQLADAGKALKALTAQVRGKVLALLTDEQRSKLPAKKKGAKRKGAKKGAKKKGAKKKAKKQAAA